VNKAIIEGMFAGVPCIVREGFNYGYRYPYINAATGRFSSERDLPDTLLAMIAEHDRYRPREWVMAHMSCERASETIGQDIGVVAHSLGEQWSGHLAVKLNGLENMYYQNPDDRTRFDADYEYLKTLIRGAR
jgi:hypothetical protein